MMIPMLIIILDLFSPPPLPIPPVSLEDLKRIPTYEVATEQYRLYGTHGAWLRKCLPAWSEPPIREKIERWIVESDRHEKTWHLISFAAYNSQYSGKSFALTYLKDLQTHLGVDEYDKMELPPLISSDAYPK